MDDQDGGDRMRTSTSILAALGASLAGLGPAHAHHSAAAYDTSEEVTFEGVIAEFGWKNPHIYITLEVAGPDGAIVEQEIEAGSSSVLLPLGLAADSVSPGEHVVVRANPSRRGSGRMALGRTLTKDDGTVLPLYIGERSIRPPVEARAESIAGTWFSPLSAFAGLGGARRSSWTLTEAGQASIDAYDGTTQSVHAQCIPIGAPALMVYPVAMVVTMEADRVVFDIDWMTSQRVVHLDQAEHPADLEPSLQGHSIGWWEGDTLVIDTVGFAPHREGLGFGLASGAGKHLVERFSVSEDGRHLDYAVTVEDPEYVVGTGSYAAQWDYRPDLTASGLPCDLEIAQRFLEQ
jgi:hypothetical protein